MNLQSVIVSLGEPLTIDRRAPGVWVDGIYVQDDATQITTVASVQPISGTQARLLPEGVRADDAKSVWATMLLRTAQDPSGAPADEFSYGGWRYQVISLDDWYTGPQGAYSKAIAARIRQEIP
jgi:hypothetical protein